MSPFLKLDDFLAPLPFPAIIAILMIFGFYYLGTRLIRWLPIETPLPIHSATGFIVTASLIAAAVHLLALLGVAYLWLLRVLAWWLLILRMWFVLRLNREWLRTYYSKAKAIFLAQSFWGRAALCLLGIVGIGLMLAALGPPTDADSLNYHLGVPLDILRHHKAYPRPDWFFARLAGLGESLNTLGLACGTDILGAALQFAGLLIALTGVISFAKTDQDRILMAVLMLGCPVVVSLVPSQKPQMLPIAATTVAIILIARRFQTMDGATILLAFWCAFFAMACKYTFITTGVIVVGLGMLAAYRAKRLSLAMGMALAIYLVIVFPGQLQNFLFYGDPVSPFLERFRPIGDAAVMKFAVFYQDYSIPETKLIPFPLNLFVPISIEMVPTVLGLGLLLVLFGLKQVKENFSKVLLIGALLAAPFELVLSKMGGRYLFELYLWVIPVAAATPWRTAKTLLFKIMTGQLLAVSLIIIYGAVSLFPGALTASLREKVMARAAYGYSECRWLNEVLPVDATVLAWNRSLALLPRPFLSRDFIDFSNLEDAIEREKIRRLLELNRVNILIAYFPLDEGTVSSLGPLLGKCVAGPAEFALGFRNPWNRKYTARLAVYRLYIKQPLRNLPSDD